jgi:hypothetical protein
MIFRPHENEVNFDPDVRLPQMEAEELIMRSKKPPIDLTNKGFHDRALYLAEKATKLRNIEIGGASSLFAGSIISERVLELNLIPHTTIGGLAVGLVAGISSGEISRQNTKKKTNEESALRWAAYEAKDTVSEGNEVPDWAAYRLQEASMTADEVLKLSK